MIFFMRYSWLRTFLTPNSRHGICVGTKLMQSYELSFNTKSRKKLTKFLRKLKKTLIFGRFWPILPFLRKRRISMKNWTLSVFKFYDYVPSWKKKKTNARLTRKISDWPMHRRREIGHFIELQQELQQLKLHQQSQQRNA